MAKARRKHAPRLPNHVFVWWNGDTGDDSFFLSADQTTNSADDGQVIGVYVLQEKKTLRINRDLK